MLSVDPTYYLQAILAAVYVLLLKGSRVAHVDTDCLRYWVGYSLVGKHCDLFPQVHPHRLVIEHSPDHQFFGLGFRSQFDHRLSLLEELVALELQFLDEIGPDSAIMVELVGVDEVFGRVLGFFLNELLPHVLLELRVDRLTSKKRVRKPSALLA